MGEVAQLFEVKELSCNRCLLSLPVSEFSKNSHKARGYKYTCKKCTDYKGQYAVWRDRHMPDRPKRGSILDRELIGQRISEGHQKRRDAWKKDFDIRGVIKCSGCNIDKLATEFTRDRRRFTGYMAQCGDCSRESKRRNGRNYYHSNKEKLRPLMNWYRKKVEYGVTKEDYYRMLAAQGGCCAICKRLENKNKLFHIDHNHKTGRVRGLLCKNCNNGIGMLGDSITIIKSAAMYLEERGGYGA